RPVARGILALRSRYFFLADFRRGDDLRRGTFAPAARASERPIAMACLRLLTFLPLRPLLSVPSFSSCMARLTLAWAFLPYLAIHFLLRRDATPTSAPGVRAGNRRPARQRPSRWGAPVSVCTRRQ